MINALLYLGFKVLGSGGTREVYTKDDISYVIKVPLYKSSQQSNIGEVHYYKKKLVPVAQCSLRILFGVVCCRMVKVQPICTPNNYYDQDEKFKEMKRISQSHAWISGLDSGQVGRTKTGRIVAFDCGNFYYAG